ncbi:3080_t:CDS:1, partial [Ambispora gerdemannii]
LEEFEPELKVSTSNTRTVISNCSVIIKSRKVKLAADIEIYKKLVKIISDNIENDKFYE